VFIHSLNSIHTNTKVRGRPGEGKAKLIGDGVRKSKTLKSITLPWIYICRFIG